MIFSKLNQRMKKSVIALFMTVCLLIPAVAPLHISANDNAAPELQMLPVNPELLEYLAELNQTQSSGEPDNDSFLSDNILITESSMSGDGVSSQIPNGYIPPPVTYTQEEPESVPFAPFVFAPNNLPPTYDLRNATSSDPSNVTPPKDQQSLGVCWAFAANGALESFLKINSANFSNDTINDWSENHMRHALSRDGNNNAYGFHRRNYDGGNFSQAATYYMRGKFNGAVKESDDPYDNDPNPRAVTTTEGESPTLRVTGTATIPNSQSGHAGGDNNNTYRNNIKKAVYEFGAVGISYYSTGSVSASGQTGSNYYYNGGSKSNHAVLIVGWKDDYSRELFSGAKPSGNGAWLVKNSWGTTWQGEDGYFWMSYYSKIEGAFYITGADEEFDSGTDKILEHDPFGVTGETTYHAPTAYFANIFTAGAGYFLTDVVVYNNNPNSTYKIYVNVGETNSVLLSTESGAVETINAKSGAVETTGSFTYPGYYTIKLAEPIDVRGKKFSIIVETSTGNSTEAKIPVSASVPNYCSVTVVPNVSYASPYGTSQWNEISGGNACIKAVVSSDVGFYISKQPKDIEVLKGHQGDLELSVLAKFAGEDDANITYQWYSCNSDGTGGQVLNGATGDTYTLPDNPQNTLGRKYYYVEATYTPATPPGGAAETLTSNVVSVTVTPVKIEFTEDLSAEAVPYTKGVIAAPLTVDVKVTRIDDGSTSPVTSADEPGGGGDEEEEEEEEEEEDDGLTYEWYKNGTKIDDEETNSYTPLTDEIGEFEYYVVVSTSFESEDATPVSITIMITSKTATIVVKGSSAINYNIEDVIVSGDTEGFSINLTQETITIASGYTVKAYSVDGGAKWKKFSKTFDDKLLGKLLNKGLKLQLSDVEIDKDTKKPPESDETTIVSFPEIKARPKLNKLVVNYAIFPDETGGTAGAWTLSEKGGSDSKTDGILVALAAASRKTPDENGYGIFGDNGVGVMELPSSGKPVKTVYFIKTAPEESEGGQYTAGSKPKKISVAGQQKTPKYKITKNVTVKYKKNTYISLEGNLPTFQADKGELSIRGTVYLWTGATEKKPASAKQELKP